MLSSVHCPLVNTAREDVSLGAVWDGLCQMAPQRAPFPQQLTLLRFINPASKTERSPFGLVFAYRTALAVKLSRAKKRTARKLR